MNITHTMTYLFTLHGILNFKKKFRNFLAQITKKRIKIQR